MLLIILMLPYDDEELLKSLYETQNVKMYNIAYKILSTNEDAEEAVQEAFIRIMEHIDKIKKIPCPERVPFCVVIVKNISKNMLRDRKNHASIEEFDCLAADMSSNPQVEFFSHMDSAHLVQIMRELSTSDRDILLMKWGKKLKYREIGKIMGISEDAAMKRGQRALERLRIKYTKGISNV